MTETIITLIRRYRMTRAAATEVAQRGQYYDNGIMTYVYYGGQRFWID